MLLTVKKALDLLTVLSERPEEPQSSGVLAKKVNMHPSTCSVMLKSLVKYGLIAQNGKRQGYTLGPMVYFLARNGPYQKHIVLAAEPVMRRLVNEFQETVLLAALNQKSRILLSVIEGNQEVRISRTHLFLDDIYQTATGRLLLAYLTPEERQAWIVNLGWPGAFWPEADSKQGMDKALARIRAQGYAVDQSHRQSVQLAFPIRQDDKVVAALGMPLPAFRFARKRRKAIMQSMKKAADDISFQNNSLKEVRSIT